MGADLTPSGAGFNKFVDETRSFSTNGRIEDTDVQWVVGIFQDRCGSDEFEAPALKIRQGELGINPV